jgi:hypothetical protein
VCAAYGDEAVICVFFQGLFPNRAS